MLERDFANGVEKRFGYRVHYPIQKSGRAFGPAAAAWALSDRDVDRERVARGVVIAIGDGCREVHVERFRVERCGNIELDLGDLHCARTHKELDRVDVVRSVDVADQEADL